MHSEIETVSLSDLRRVIDAELTHDRETNRLREYLSHGDRKLTASAISDCEAFIHGYILSAVTLLETLIKSSGTDSFKGTDQFVGLAIEYWAERLDVIPDYSGALGRLDDAFLTNTAWFKLMLIANPEDKKRISALEAANAYAASILQENIASQLIARAEALVVQLSESNISELDDLDRDQMPGYYNAVPRPPKIKLNLPGIDYLLRSEETSGIMQSDTGRDNEDDMSEDAYTYDVWFGTNRAPINLDSISDGFSNKRDPDGSVYYGQCSVDIPKSHTFGSIGTPWYKRWIKLRFADDHVELKDIEVFSSRAEFASDLKADLARMDEADRCILLYIHGFNVSFEEAAIRAAQFGFDLKVPGVTAFYSWPSKATMEAYPADIAGVEASETQLADFLTLLANETGANTVHIVAHSMGNRGFGRAISRITAHASRTTSIRFGQIILAAPDLDVDLFKQFAEVYPRISERTTMYVSARDKALGLSGWLQDSDRAGFTPPITIQPGIDTVEVTDIDLTVLGHGYYAAASAVLYDIKQLIDNSTPPSRRLRIKSRDQNGHKYWVFKK